MHLKLTPEWRAFWTSAIVFGAVNAGLGLYYFACPIRPIGKGGTLDRDVPDWHCGVTVAINMPGGILALPILIAVKSESEQFNGGLFMLAGTLVWATGIATYVNRSRRSVQFAASASNPIRGLRAS